MKTASILKQLNKIFQNDTIKIYNQEKNYYYIELNGFILKNFDINKIELDNSEFINMYDNKQRVINFINKTKFNCCLASKYKSFSRKLQFYLGNISMSAYFFSNLTLIYLYFSFRLQIHVLFPKVLDKL